MFKAIAMAAALSIGGAAMPALQCAPAPTNPPPAGVPTMGNQGFLKARNGNRQSITVANPSALGFNMIEAVAEWNELAGWKLFDVYPVDDPYGLVHADIRIAPTSPIWVGGTRRPLQSGAVLQPGIWPTNPNGTVNGPIKHCNMLYDATYPNRAYQMHPDTWSHDLGHCLGIIGGGSDQTWWYGVMGYGGNNSGMNQPWEKHDPPWWGSDDAAMLVLAGYRKPEGG